MGIFKGIRTKNGAFVTYDDIPLELRLDLKEHSPMGFEWGYNGSGSKQLALAMLTKITSDESALDVYKEFCKAFVEPINDKEWDLDDFLVREWLKLNDVICDKPLLTPRFKLINSMMYLDNSQLGKHLDFSTEYNTEITLEGTTTYCNFSEIYHLHIKELPEHIKFEFVAPIGGGDEEAHIHENFTHCSILNLEETLVTTFWLWIDISEYRGFRNIINTGDAFLENLKGTFENIDIEYGKVEDSAYIAGFSIKIKDKNNNLQEVVTNTVNQMLAIYEDTFSDASNFEATFNLPQEYKGVLKSYIQYFEEFLNDLCIKADVDITTNGSDTILSVTPQNKDEALEKIADALKAYLCAPVVASNVSVEESLQMQTVATKLYAQCKNLESQMMYKEISIREQNQQIEIKDNIINESKRILVEAGIDTNIITQNNTMLLESLKSMKINNKATSSKTFLRSIKASIQIPEIFSGSLEIERKKV